MGKTDDNLKAAFAGEAKAAFRLKAFAAKAENEGYGPLAKLFRAVSEAESVHAMRHIRHMKLVGPTEENLQYAFEQETSVTGNHYPQFILDANEEGNSAVATSFSYTRDAEESHASLYKRALDHFANEKEVDYYVCSVCGYIAEGEAPDVCPVCNSKKQAFKKVE